MKSLRWGIPRIKGNQAMFGTEAAIRKMIPFWDNHSNWENISYIKRRLIYLLIPETLEDLDRYSKSDLTMSEETAKAFKEMESNSHKWELDEDQRAAFKRIADFCRQKGSKLVIVMAPIYKEWRNHVDYESRHKEIQKLADECGVLFIDYNDAELYDRMGINESWFRNDMGIDNGNTHMNSYGASNISKDLAERLLECNY